MITTASRTHCCIGCYVLAEFEGRDKMVAAAISVLIGLIILIIYAYFDSKNKK